MRRAICLARRRSDVVVVSFHWGTEYRPKPQASQKQLGRWAVDCGADVVVGHHPHVAEPLEIYRGRPIAYSLGNFVFDQRKHKAHEGAILVASLHRARVTGARLVPVSVQRGQPRE